MTRSTFLSRIGVLASCFLLAHTLSSQNFPLVTPQNINEVIAELYAFYGPQIQVQPDQLYTFLSQLQPQYNPDMNAPDAAIQDRGPDWIKFFIQPGTGGNTRLGQLNLADNSQMTDQTQSDEYTFSGLNNNDLYLFAFVASGTDGESGIFLFPTVLDYIIIIDEKILYSGECARTRDVGSGANMATAGLQPNTGAFFRFYISSCMPPNLSYDMFYLYLFNRGASIDARLFTDNALPQNSDNYIVANNIIASTGSPYQFSLRSTGFVNNQFTQFEILKVPSNLSCVRISISRCDSGPENRTVAAQNKVSVFPSPASDFVVLDGETGLQNANKIELRDQLGSLLYSTVQIPQGGSFPLQLPENSEGLLLLLIYGEAGVEVHKILRTGDK